MKRDVAEIADVLRDAVARGAELARREFHQRSFAAGRKSDGTAVTSADIEVERRISARLEERLPEIALVGEELSGELPERMEAYIAIDPIDGTSNFVRGVPLFAVAAVYVERGRALAGVVADPVHETTYWAVRGEGAFRNGERLVSVPGPDTLSRATLCLPAESLPKRLRVSFLPELARRVGRHQALRSVALEIAGLAAGWADAAIYGSIKVWDFGASSLLLEEVGGVWSRLDGKPADFRRPAVRHSFCGARRRELHRKLIEMAGG